MRLSVKAGVFLFFILLFIALPGSALAQSGDPGNTTPAGTPAATATSTPAAAVAVPTGVITGKIVNKNDSSKTGSNLEVMLHVLDQNQNELGMLHGKSGQDSAFQIAEVPFQAGMGYVVAVTYEGTTYYSALSQQEAGKTSLNLDVPIYESTPDLSKVEIGQMHVLFSFASDGMDIKEFYALSNLDDRTVKDGVDIPGKSGAKAAVKFSLPEKADFVNFQPQDEARFVKFPGGFVDAAPIVPGEMSSQFVVAYLLPYSDPIKYELKTVLPAQTINLVVPKASGVTLKGEGLGEPEPVTAQDGQLFYLYKLKNIPAGKTLSFSFEGKPVIPKTQAAPASTASSSTPSFPNQMPLFAGLSLLGVALIGSGAFLWVRSSRMEADVLDVEEDLEPEAEFDCLLTEIAQLDQRFEQGEIDEESYRNQRELLMTQAKAAQATAAAGTAATAADSDTARENELAEK